MLNDLFANIETLNAENESLRKQETVYKQQISELEAKLQKAQQDLVQAQQKAASLEFQLNQARQEKQTVKVAANNPESQLRPVPNATNKNPSTLSMQSCELTAALDEVEDHSELSSELSLQRKLSHALIKRLSHIN